MELILLAAFVLVCLVFVDPTHYIKEPRKSIGWLDCNPERWNGKVMMPIIVPYGKREKK